ncbi:MAG: hypothetical protein A2Y67_03170 [Candidatus Buchananbacteria bacterium RBG_13_39_9]|uniref:Dephospho-CoA kinase n=1 Tax=Candidatus Buchananbacteria bacterium RBG_13_39_9 TaxID=1797531 RepID=A0A1G1XRW4_9BACT|nr:MAG: hypothetical protein A2Y67_03170 [Candidatus Buchananbacteria bacterium RBG_13_39_9]
MEKIILAIVGLPGAGKTEITNYLQKKFGWPKIYFGQAVFDEIANRGLEINEQNEKQVREDLRKKHGMAAMAILNIPKIKELYENSSVIIESLYSWEEYLEVKNEFADKFFVLAVYSSPQTRIERLGKRPERPLTAEQVQSRDIAQIENLHQAGPIARADFTIINEGAKEEACKQADNFIATI